MEVQITTETIREPGTTVRLLETIILLREAVLDRATEAQDHQLEAVQATAAVLAVQVPGAVQDLLEAVQAVQEVEEEGN